MAEEKIVKKASPEKPKKPSVFKKMGKFFKELKSEIAKVVWPTPKQVLDNTVTVLVVMLICAVFIGVVDWLFKAAVNFVMTIG